MGRSLCSGAQNRMKWPTLQRRSFKHNYRDLSENAITTVQKGNWLPYRWTENLDLHGNQLVKLQKDSFEGLILLKKLILSGNVISKIAGFTFQALPFLEILDLSDNKLTALLDGTFKSWHGLRFFRKFDLSGTKLSVQTMYPAFMAVPNIVQLDLPDGVRCCLCYVARTVEILFKTVKLDCPNRCASDTSCDESETILMINGTVLRSQISLKNQGVLESFLNQNTDTSANLSYTNSFARSSKVGLLHQIEENEKNIYVGNHLDPHQAATKAKSVPHSSRIRQRPSFESDLRFIPQYGRADNLQLNIDGRIRRSHIPLGNIVSGKKPLHHLYFALSDSYNHALPVEASSKFNTQDKDFNFKKHKVIKRVKKELASEQQANNRKEVKLSTVEISETTTEQPKIIYELESVYPDVVELVISTPAEPETKATVNDSQENIIVYELTSSPKVIKLQPEEIFEVQSNVSKSSEKAEQKSLLRQAPILEHFSRTLQQIELVHPGDNEVVNSSSESWHKPLGEFLDNAVQKNVDISFSPTPLTETTKKRSQVELVNLFKERYRKYKEGNYPQQQNEDTRSEQQTTTYPYIDIHKSNKDLFPPVHSKKTVKESVKTSSSNNSKIKMVVDDMFEAKLNEAVQAVEPNKDIQRFFAHLIRIINIDCLKPELEAACTNLLIKIGNLMKEYEGIKYLPEQGNWNPSVLRPDENGEGDVKKPEIFPPPISRPEQKLKEHKGRDGAKITYVPNYSEVHAEQPKKMATSSTVGYGHKLLLAVAVTVIVMLIITVICVIEICSQRSEPKTPYATGDAACKSQSKSLLKKFTEQVTGKKSNDAEQTSPLIDDIEQQKSPWLQDLYRPSSQFAINQLVTGQTSNSP
ncbi:leucine-rich repeat-containing protein 37A-like isoform X2 [Hemitrygon akajei]|uniref:leucine-rich repeat-containing protein 37A-like isoform X2 n=1 Tax=Hemitrygon akajei TaxID=2704970 RepID=UPI003BF94B34